jgi:hypothetical protein
LSIMCFRKRGVDPTQVATNGTLLKLVCHGLVRKR